MNKKVQPCIAWYFSKSKSCRTYTAKSKVILSRRKKDTAVTILVCKSRVENIDNSTNIRLHNCTTHDDKKCDLQLTNTARNMRKYGFSLTRIFAHFME